MSEYLDTLRGLETGRYSVMTETGSAYVLDLDRSTLCRRPAAPDLTMTSGTTNMRRDGEDVELIAWASCSVGAIAEFLVDLDLPTGYLTTRRTTMVLSIIRLDEPDLAA